MSQGTRGNTRKTEEKDFEYEERVPKELWAHNKPGAKDFNAPGTVHVKTGAVPKKKKEEEQTKEETKPKTGGGWGIPTFGDYWRAQRTQESEEEDQEEDRDSSREFHSPDGSPKQDLNDVLMQTVNDLTANTSALNLNLNLSDGDVTMSTDPPPQGAAGGGDGRPLQISREEWDEKVNELENLKTLLAGMAIAPKGATKIADGKLEKFKGDTDTRQADMWYEKAESMRLQCSWSDIQFIEACLGAMTEGAEEWVKSVRYDVVVKNSNLLTDREAFREAFMKRFNLKQSAAAHTRQMEALRQGANETCMAFWTRVRNLCDDLVRNHVKKKNLMPIPPGGANPAGNEDFRRRAWVHDFTTEEVCLQLFMTGLLQSLSDQIAPRVNELLEKGGAEKVLEAVVDAEAAMKKGKPKPATSNLDLAALLTEQGASAGLIAAFESSFNRGRGGGGRGGRGGFRGRGGGGRGGGGGQAPGGDLAKLRAIQSRSKRRYCTGCGQWGKHSAPECRHSVAEINAMTAEDPKEQPAGPVVDKCYDGKDQMPPWPVETGNG